MMDPFGSLKNMIGQLQQFSGDRMQFMARRGLNIPQQFANDPQGAVQYLLDRGVINQQQYNWANNMARQIQGDPQVAQAMGWNGPQR